MKQFKTIPPELSKAWAKLVQQTGSTRSGIMNELVSHLKPIDRTTVSRIMNGHQKVGDPKTFTKIQNFIDKKTKLLEK